MLSQFHTEKDSVLILNCPFCGSNKHSIYQVDLDRYGSLVAVVCEFCGAQCPKATMNFDAILKWNKRSGFG